MLQCAMHGTMPCDLDKASPLHVVEFPLQQDFGLEEIPGVEASPATRHPHTDPIQGPILMVCIEADRHQGACPQSGNQKIIGIRSRAKTPRR